LGQGTGTAVFVRWTVTAACVRWAGTAAAFVRLTGGALTVTVIDCAVSLEKFRGSDHTQIEGLVDMLLLQQQHATSHACVLCEIKDTSYIPKNAASQPAVKEQEAASKKKRPNVHTLY